jgi:hypothetical protein
MTMMTIRMMSRIMVMLLRGRRSTGRKLILVKEKEAIRIKMGMIKGSMMNLNALSGINWETSIWIMLENSRKSLAQHANKELKWSISSNNKNCKKCVRK